MAGGRPLMCLSLADSSRTKANRHGEALSPDLKLVLVPRVLW